MSISINGNVINYIIDTNFINISQVAIPEWINRDSELETNIWSNKPLKIVYILRNTDSIKWILDQILLAHIAVNLTDTKYSINTNYWVYSISSTWEGHNDYILPWKIEINLIKV